VAHDYAPHFNGVAARYDGLRDELADDALELLVREADLAGRSVLDVGCGTGRTAAALTARFGCAVTGVDPSPEMLAVARERAAGADLRQGRAERLPVADGAFERALLQTSVHLVDRARALPEVRRALRPGGRLAILTVDPAGVDRFWLAEWFPSWAAIDRERFPAIGQLERELAGAGFTAIRARGHPRRLRYARERALDLLHGRFASSFALLDDAEYAAGVARAERELPADGVDTTLRLALVTAHHPK
jgi:ubiquinone/menaquinone biosynthesis C-methylase UbiE